MMPEAAHYAVASLVMADLIGTLELTLSEWKVLDLVRRHSFSAGRGEACFLKKQRMARAAGLSPTHLEPTVERLKRCLVIEERPEFCYGFMFPVGNWKIPSRAEAEVVKQLELLPRPEHVRDAMRDIFLEQCATGAKGIPGGAPGLTNSPERAGELYHTLPESGRAFISEQASRIGKDSEEPINTGVSPAVPESGSSPVLQHCSTVSSKKQYCNVAVLRVPDSGSGKAFSSEQQELMDQVVSSGACRNERNDSWRPFWIAMVRDRPAVVRELLGELRWAREKGTPIRGGTGPFMHNKWQMWGRPDK